MHRSIGTRAASLPVSPAKKKEGIPAKDPDTRYPATGPAEVVIVNPNESAGGEDKGRGGPEGPLLVVEKRVEDWVKDSE
jgi:hypothetical protein